MRKSAGSIDANNVWISNSENHRPKCTRRATDQRYPYNTTDRRFAAALRPADRFHLAIAGNIPPFNSKQTYQFVS